MKKLLIISTLVLLPFMVFAQDGKSDISGDLYTTLFGLVSGMPFIIELFKKIIKPSTTFGKKLLSWGVSIIIVFLGWHFNLGFLNGLSLINTSLIAILVGVSSNGVFDSGIVVNILQLLNIYKKKPIVIDENTTE